MSHFVGLCFGEFWESNLEQYDEELEVEAYVKFTKEEAIQEAKRRHNNDYQYAIKKLQDPDLKSEHSEYLSKIVEKGMFLSSDKAWEEAKSWGYDIDKDENLLSTYNPYSKWDWYSIGGRWRGFLALKEKYDNGDVIKTNEAYISEIDWDYMFANDNIPFCYVDENGSWFEKGTMGWWAMVSNEKDTDLWRKQFKDYIESLEDDLLVTVVDFHI